MCANFIVEKSPQLNNLSPGHKQLVNDKLICEEKVCKAFYLPGACLPGTRPQAEPSQVEEQIVQSIETALPDKKQHHEELTVISVYRGVGGWTDILLHNFKRKNTAVQGRLTPA